MDRPTVLRSYQSGKAMFLLTAVIVGEQKSKDSTVYNKTIVIKILIKRDMGWVRMEIGIRPIKRRNQDEKITQEERVGRLLWTKKFINKVS